MKSHLEEICRSKEHKLVAMARANYASYLSEAELRIIHDSVRPGPAAARPGDRRENRHVDGGFFRWLLNDARAVTLMDKDGLQVVGVTVDGKVDLDSSSIPYDLTFQGCSFADDVSFVWASTRSILILSSESHGDITFENATIAGDLSLQDGFRADGSITLYAAKIVGALSMKGAMLCGKDKLLSLNNAEVKDTVYFEKLSCAGPVWMLNTKFRNSLIANGAKFGSDVNMQGVSIDGDVDLINLEASGAFALDHARVGGGVYMAGAHLQGAKLSLSLRNAAVDGTVYAMNGFRAMGPVTLAKASIKQDLWVYDAEMPELDCSGAHVGGDLWWMAIHNPEKTKLNLAHSSINGIYDVKKSWPLKGNLRVVGLTYQDIALEVPTDAPDPTKKVSYEGGGTSPSDRIRWLNLQTDEDLGATQPWMQLAKYVEARGNVAGAKQVLYALERTEARKDGLVSSSFSFLYDVIDENPLLVLVPICTLWLLDTIIFWRARRIEAMAPTDKDAYDYFSQRHNQPDYYVPFNAVVYTLENVLPVVKFGQDAAWGPNPQKKPLPRRGWRRWLPQLSYEWLAFLRWLLIVLGWVLALILAGAVADRFKT